MNSTITSLKPDLTYYQTEGSVLGLAPLMTMACKGVDLGVLGQALLEESNQNSAASSSALMDVSIILQLKGDASLALSMQQQALTQRQLYRIPAKRQPSIRLLVLKAPGLLAANTPLEFLVEDSAIELTMLYVSPDLPFPEELPDHDVMVVAIGYSEQNIPLLKLAEDYVACWPRPVLNLPNRISPLSRDITSTLLQSVPRAVMPDTIRVERPILERVAGGEGNTPPVQINVQFPVIIRCLGSHAGSGLTKADNVHDISNYLAKTSATDFYVTSFHDYRSKDGKFRKYRLLLIDGRPYPVQMAISDNWTPSFSGSANVGNHYRYEEERFIANFDEDFGRRHAEALGCIGRRIGLEYLVIDCAETRDGKMVVLEVDSSAVVHAIDPDDTLSYRKVQMDKIVRAFSEMLFNKAKGG